MLQGEILANFVTTCSMELCALFPRAPRTCDASYGGETLAIVLCTKGRLSRFVSAANKNISGEPSYVP